jgi:hypothetical protein
MEFAELGTIYAAVIAWIMLGDDVYGHRIIPGLTWRSYAAVCALPAITAFLMTFMYVPSSPRFYLSRGDYDQALICLNKICKVDVGNADILRPKDSDSEKIKPTQLSLESLIETVQLLFSKQLVCVTCTLLGIWYIVAFGYYGITTWISILFKNIGLSNIYMDTFVFAVANLPGNLITYYYIEAV